MCRSICKSESGFLDWRCPSRGLAGSYIIAISFSSRVLEGWCWGLVGLEFGDLGFCTVFGGSSVPRVLGV